MSLGTDPHVRIRFPRPHTIAHAFLYLECLLLSYLLLLTLRDAAAASPPWVIFLNTQCDQMTLLLGSCGDAKVRTSVLSCAQLLRAT